MKKEEMNIEELKKQYGKVFSYTVELEDGTVKTVHFKQPERRVMSAATVQSKGDPIRYNEIVLNNCLIGDDKSFLEDDSVFYGLSQKVDELVNAKVGELKKL